MVHAAVTDVVTPAVAADDPLRLLHEPVLVLENLLAVVAAAGLQQRDQARRNLGRFGRRAAVFDPLLHHGFQLLGALGAVGDGLLHRLLDAVAEFLHADVHTQTELGVVLEERVGPCGTLAGGVGAVGRRGS